LESVPGAGASPSPRPLSVYTRPSKSTPLSISNLRRLTTLPNNPIQTGNGTATVAITAEKISAFLIFSGGSASRLALSASCARINTAPSNCPPVQQIVLPISGENGYVISTRYSRTMGRRAKEDAPRRAQTI
jgi:hypothetical protein